MSLFTIEYFLIWPPSSVKNILVYSLFWNLATWISIVYPFYWKLYFYSQYSLQQQKQNSSSRVSSLFTVGTGVFRGCSTLLLLTNFHETSRTQSVIIIGMKKYQDWSQSSLSSSMANGLKKTKLLTQYLELFKHPQIQICRHIHDDYSHSRQDSDGNGKKIIS